MCAPCGDGLQTGGPLVTSGGVMTWAALRHAGPARSLVHRLKYDGIVTAGDVLGAAMAFYVPASASALVPVPRATLRRWSHGVDPARVLAHAMARTTGLPVVAALRPAAWWPRHAGRRADSRSAAVFRAAGTPDPGWVLVDDVVTTGTTIDAASAALGSVVRMAVAATSPSRVSPWGRGTDLEGTAQA